MKTLSRCDEILENFDSVLSLVENITMINGFTEDDLRRHIADQEIKKITDGDLPRKIVAYDLPNELTNNLRLSQSYTSLV